MNVRYVLLTLLYCLGIFLLSSSENPVHIKMRFHQEDKVLHAVLYGGLAGVVSLGIRRSGKPVRASIQFWVPIVFAALYAVSDELHQFFVPGRNCDILDVLADTVGAIVVSVVLCRYVWRIRAIPWETICSLTPNRKKR